MSSSQTTPRISVDDPERRKNCSTRDRQKARPYPTTSWVPSRTTRTPTAIMPTVCPRWPPHIMVV